MRQGAAYRVITGYRLAALAFVLALAGCSSGSGPRVPARFDHGSQVPVGEIDPWRTYVREASARFDVPEPWIRAVIEVESGGNTHVNGKPIVSGAGAMGLMQLMPGTWDYVRRRYGLSDDPFDPRNNILGGTAYLREMYDRFGVPGAFAAYNAGPGRLDTHLEKNRVLPNETRAYMATIWPAVQGSWPRNRSATDSSQRIAVDRGPPERVRRVTQAAWVGDPERSPSIQLAAAQIPKTSPPPPTPLANSPALITAGSTDTATNSPVRQTSRPATANLAGPVRRPETGANNNLLVLASTKSAWSVQVGAFRNREQADRAANAARSRLPTLLARARTASSPIETNAGTLFRSRLTGLVSGQAGEACRQILAQGADCRVIPPEQL